MSAAPDGSLRPTGYSPTGEPIAAIATALAPAAIGMVRTSGNGCAALLAKAFSRPSALMNAKGNTIVHGWIIDSNGERIDEVMVSVFRAPKSFTGEEAAEVTCHGGAAVVCAVHKRLLEAGFRQAERGEFTLRAYINGKTDLTRAEAVREIIDSRTGVALRRAARRLSGSVYNEAMAIKGSLLEVLAAITAQVEYPEDESTGEGELDTGALEMAACRLQRLESTWKSERLYQEGARVVLCGEANAGKSSLFNVLLKEERAIVSPVAGTTRDWIEAEADFDGILVTLFDTAGLRHGLPHASGEESIQSNDAIEAEGVSRSEKVIQTADVVLYVVDGTIGITAADNEFLNEYQMSQQSGGMVRYGLLATPQYGSAYSGTTYQPTAEGMRGKSTPCIVLWNKADIWRGTPQEAAYKSWLDGVKKAVAQCATWFDGFDTPLRATESPTPQAAAPECRETVCQGAACKPSVQSDGVPQLGQMAQGQSEKGAGGENGSAVPPRTLRGHQRPADYLPTDGSAVNAIQTSSKTGQGIAELVSKVHNILQASAAADGGGCRASDIQLGSSRQHDAVLSALVCVSHALEAADMGYPLDALSQDIEDALESLGLLTGEVRPIDVLESVFGRFCVGK